MLLEFSISNYKSFKGKITFSMIPSSKKRGLDYSIMKERAEKKEYKGLSSAVIYGPNAAGKTNIIGAMDTFKKIVLRGHIRNSEEENNNNPNVAAFNLELIPFFKNTSDPVTFGIKFIENGILFDYSFSMDIGAFMDKLYRRKIQSEVLKINEKIIFARTDELIIKNLDSIKDYLNAGVDNNDKNYLNIANNGLNQDELFLVNGFKTIYSKNIVSIISEWLSKKFFVYYRANSIQSIPVINELEEGQAKVDFAISEVAHIFGANSDAIAIVKDNQKLELCSVVDREKGVALPITIFESYGTERFINEFPIIIQALVKGATVVIDEFDASLHPMALMNIINIFHNDTLNIKHAQLIFNTQNPIFLNNTLYRRDEIKFVEINRETHESSHYSLSDFKTYKGGTRRNSDYMKNYFINQYGAIQDIDFNGLVGKIMDAVKKSESKK